MREPEAIKLFYVMSEDENGEDRSLLVRETVLYRALKAWREYYELPDTTPEVMPRRVTIVPIDPVIGAIPWGNCTDVYPFPNSARKRKARARALTDTTPQEEN